MSLLDGPDFLHIKHHFQYRNGSLSEMQRQFLKTRITETPRNKVALGGSCDQKRNLFQYGFYDRLVPDFHPYVQNIIDTIEDEEKKAFEKNRPPGTSAKPLRHRLTNIILSFLAAFYQSKSEFWTEEKQIDQNDLPAIAAACRAQIILANRIAINRAKNIFHAAKRFLLVAKHMLANREGFEKDALDKAHHIDTMISNIRESMIQQRTHFERVQQPQQFSDNDSDEDSEEDDEEREKRKQMTYSELVRNFSMHSEVIQRDYLDARRKLEKKFDYNQFVKVRNCLAYQFLLSNSARSEVVTYLQWKEVEKAQRVTVDKDPEDDFIMVPFYDHKNAGRGIHANKPLYLGMERWMLFDLTFLRGHCVPGNKFVFPSGKAHKQICLKGMNASRVTNMMSQISQVAYKDHLHWIRSSATNAACISTEQSTSQMVPDMDLVILNGHSMQTAQKHYMRLDNKERCIIAARAYVKLAKKRRDAMLERQE